MRAEFEMGTSFVHLGYLWMLCIFMCHVSLPEGSGHDGGSTSTMAFNVTTQGCAVARWYKLELPGPYEIMATWKIQNQPVILRHDFYSLHLRKWLLRKCLVLGHPALRGTPFQQSWVTKDQKNHKKS